MLHKLLMLSFTRSSKSNKYIDILSNASKESSRDRGDKKKKNDHNYLSWQYI